MGRDVGEVTPCRPSLSLASGRYSTGPDQGSGSPKRVIVGYSGTLGCDRCGPRLSLPSVIMSRGVGYADQVIGDVCQRSARRVGGDGKAAAARPLEGGRDDRTSEEPTSRLRGRVAHAVDQDGRGIQKRGSSSHEPRCSGGDRRPRDAAGEPETKKAGKKAAGVRCCRAKAGRGLASTALLRFQPHLYPTPTVVSCKGAGHWAMNSTMASRSASASAENLAVLMRCRPVQSRRCVPQPWRKPCGQPHSCPRPVGRNPDVRPHAGFPEIEGGAILRRAPERYNVGFNAGGPQPARPCRMCMCT